MVEIAHLLSLRREQMPGRAKTVMETSSQDVGYIVNKKE